MRRELRPGHDEGPDRGTVGVFVQERRSRVGIGGAPRLRDRAYETITRNADDFKGLEQGVEIIAV